MLSVEINMVSAIMLNVVAPSKSFLNVMEHLENYRSINSEDHSDFSICTINKFNEGKDICNN
jgi:hypothetical protein